MFVALQSDDNEAAQTNLRELFDKHHKSILDDYIHIISNHNHLASKMKYIDGDIHCDEHECIVLQNFEKGQTKSGEQVFEDNDFSFYKDLMTTLHCYLMHSPESMNKNYQAMTRFQAILLVDDKSTPLLDQLHDFLLKHAKEEDTDKIERFIMDEEYDSDALKIDIEIRPKTKNRISNIEIFDESMAKIIRQYLYLSKRLLAILSFPFLGIFRIMLLFSFFV